MCRSCVGSGPARPNEWRSGIDGGLRPLNRHLPSFVHCERQPAALERDSLFAEHLAAPPVQRRHVGAIVKRDAFEILDRRDHFGRNPVLLGRHAQQHLEELDRGAAIGALPRLVEAGQFGRVARHPPPYRPPELPPPLLALEPPPPPPPPTHP